MPKTHKAHIEKYNRQSKNIEDLRDKPVGPKGVLKPTKAKKVVETKSKLIRNALDSEVTTSKSSLKDIPETAGSYARNRVINNQRQGKFGDRLGVKLKNKDLDSKPTSFVKGKKKKT